MYLRPKGYSVVTDGWGIETREDTHKCVHCQKILFIKAGQDPSEYTCRKCMMPRCDRPECLVCDHWEKKLDREEATDRWLWQRFGEKLDRAKTDTDYLAIRRAMERERFLRDLG